MQCSMSKSWQCNGSLNFWDVTIVLGLITLFVTTEYSLMCHTTHCSKDKWKLQHRHVHGLPKFILQLSIHKEQDVSCQSLHSQNREFREGKNKLCYKHLIQHKKWGVASMRSINIQPYLTTIEFVWFIWSQCLQGPLSRKGITSRIEANLKYNLWGMRVLCDYSFVFEHTRPKSNKVRENLWPLIYASQLQL